MFTLTGSLTDGSVYAQERLCLRLWSTLDVYVNIGVDMTGNLYANIIEELESVNISVCCKP